MSPSVTVWEKQMIHQTMKLHLLVNSFPQLTYMVVLTVEYYTVFHSVYVLCIVNYMLHTIVHRKY